MKFQVALLSIILLFVVSQDSNAANPAPYTQKALQRLTSVLKETPAPIPPVGATNEEMAKLYINYYRQLYKKAGYNLDDSVIQLISDNEKENGFAYLAPYNATAAYFTQSVFYQIYKLTEQIPPDKFLSGKMLTSISNMITQSNKEMNKRREAKEAAEREKEKRAKEEDEQKRKESVEREEAQIKKSQEREAGLLNLIQGTYQATEGSEKSIKGLKKVGALSVTVISEDKIKFSLYRISMNQKCSISGGEMPLTYHEYNGFKAIYGTMEHNTPCGIEMKFGKRSYRGDIDGSIVEVNQRGRCPSFCERGGTFSGRFMRVTKQE